MIRTSSVLTKGEVKELSVIKGVPIFTGGTEDDASLDVFEDLIIDVCVDSGLLQLRNLVSPSVLYSKFHSEALGGVWTEHHRLFSELVAKYQNENYVLEVGGANSHLALGLLNSDANIKTWTIIEPNITEKHDNSRLFYINEFFSENLKWSDVYFDMVVHSHVLEHLHDPHPFLTTIQNRLKYGDLHIFSVPNLYSYLKNNYINALTFEHTLFLTEEYVDYLMSRYGFKTLEKVYYEDHSIMYVTQRGKTLPLPLPNRYDKHKEMYTYFFYHYLNFVDKLNRKLENTTKTVYLFGGHIFSQYLLALGLNRSFITGVLDNSKIKCGKRLYGTNFTIQSPMDVDLDNSVVILKAGSYSGEIKRQLLEISNNIQFYE